MLIVDHNNAVVTSRLGRVYRVLGAGAHKLDAFERIWDIVDLRPQRRSLVVAFMTTDGIPAMCPVSLVCHADVPRDFRPVGGDAQKLDDTAKGARDALLKLTTNRFVRRLEGPNRASDWVAGIANGALDGIVRDKLEQYSLNHFVNPQHWLQGDELPSRTAAEPEVIPVLEREIRAELEEVAASRGIVIDSVELGIVQPSEEAISQQWLAFWRAKLQRRVDKYVMDAEAKQTELVVQARTTLQAEFVGRVIKTLNTHRERGETIPDALVLESVLAVLRSMYDWGPDSRRMLFQQGESLVRFVNMVLYGQAGFPPGVMPPAGPGGPRPDAGSPTGKTSSSGKRS